MPKALLNNLAETIEIPQSVPVKLQQRRRHNLARQQTQTTKNGGALSNLHIPQNSKKIYRLALDKGHPAEIPNKCQSLRLLGLALTVALLLQQISAVQAHCRSQATRSCETICHSTTATGMPVNCTIRALVLLPDDDYYMASLKRVLPILKVAEQHVREKAIVPSHIDFEWMAKDDKCDASYAVINAMDGIVKECAHVIFGPVCDYSLAAVGRITKYFNSNGMPLISVGGSTYDFEKKKTTCADEFYMLLRTGMLSFETISELTISVMKRHNWSRSIFYYERDGQKNVAGLHTCYLMMNSLGKQMRKEHMTFAQYPLNSMQVNRTEEMIREIGNKHSSLGKCASSILDLEYLQ